MTISVVLLQENVPGSTLSELVDSVDKLTTLQSMHGASSINSAAFIVIALFCILVMGSVFGLLIRSILNQQKLFAEKFLNNTDTISKFKESFDKNTEVMNEVKNFLTDIRKLSEDKAKKEVNSDQVYTIVKWSLEQSKRKIDLDVQNIINQNNLNNVAKVEEKIDNVIQNVHTTLLQGLNKFEIEGKELGNFVLQDDFIKKKRDLIISYIYPENNAKNRDRDKFNRDLDTLFETIQNKIKGKIR